MFFLIVRELLACRLVFLFIKVFCFCRTGFTMSNSPQSSPLNNLRQYRFQKDSQRILPAASNGTSGKNGLSNVGIGKLLLIIWVVLVAFIQARVFDITNCRTIYTVTKSYTKCCDAFSADRLTFYVIFPVIDITGMRSTFTGIYIEY